LTNGTVKAAVGWNGRTVYDNILPDDRGFFTKVAVKLGLSGAKASREIARELYGFSAAGSVNYPDVAYLSSWKTFTPK
jgi:hypothetical protein